MERGRDIIPSSLSLRETPAYDDGGVFDNWMMRLGEVQEIIFIDDDRSRTKQFTEYNVWVQHRDGGVGVGTMYTNCLLQNTFGAFADECHYTLRVPEKPSTQDDKAKNGLGLGAKVFIICPNGERNNAYIMGGMRESQLDERDKKVKDNGHHFFWTFNGISAFVSSDGEFELLYKGKNNIKGEVSDEVSDGAKLSHIQMFKNGDIKLGTKDEKQLVHLDAENGKVIIKRDKALEIGEATDKMLLGESFRDSQQKLHDKLKQYFKLAKNFFQQAGTQLNTAGGAVAGPFMAASAGPPLIAASQFLVQAANVMDQMAQSIDDFETSGKDKNSFLSDVNFAD